MLRRLFRTKPFFIKLLNREYWPIWINYLPVYPYYLYLSARARSFFFFSAANPNIETGGMTGESKIAIMDLIADEYKPKSLFIKEGTSAESVVELLKKEDVNYPIVIKPDIGERGLLVSKVNDEATLRQKLAENPINLIIQPFITYDEEYAIMYYRYPDQQEGKITSITKKEFLSVVGNGENTLQELIWQQSRAILQWKKLKVKYANQLTEILPKGKKMELVSIGNHSTGTMFIDANHINDKELERVFDKIALGMEGVYFGRFDLKCRSVADMKAGKTIQIVEFNGVGAEPTHIYDPNCSLWECYRALLNQWSIVYKIGTAVHHQLGVPYMTMEETRRRLRENKIYKEGLNV
jgi:hypothetical protein